MAKKTSCVVKIDRIILNINTISLLDNYIENSIRTDLGETNVYYEILYDEIFTLCDQDKNGKFLPIRFYMDCQSTSIFDHLHHIAQIMKINYVGIFDISMKTSND